MGTRYLILDIDTRGMQAMIWEKKFSGFTCTDQAAVNLSELPDPLPKDGLWYRAALDVLAAKTELSSCTEALVLIPCRKVFFRNISLPFSSPGKVSQVLPFELAPYLPEDDCVSDFISQDVRFVKDLQLLLTASVPETLVQEITGSLKAWRIRPRIITPGETTLADVCLQQSGHVPDRIVICEGRTDITLILTAGSRPVMVRTLASSGRTLDTVADNMVRMATGFRHRSGLDTRFHICLMPGTDVMNPASMTQKIQQTPALEACFFTDTVTAMEPDPAILPDLMFKKPGNRFNFSGQAHGSGAFFHKFRRELTATGIIGVLVVILFVSGLYQSVHHLEKQVSGARRAGVEIYRQTFPRDVILPGHSPVLRMQANVRQALQQKGGTRFRDMADTPDSPAIDVLYELSARIPDGMNLRLSRLMLNNNQVTISGTTDSFNTVDRLKNTLEQSDIFKTVTINTADAARAENQVIFQFRIEM